MGDNKGTPWDKASGKKRKGIQRGGRKEVLWKRQGVQDYSGIKVRPRENDVRSWSVNSEEFFWQEKANLAVRLYGGWRTQRKLQRQDCCRMDSVRKRKEQRGKGSGREGGAYKVKGTPAN